MKAGFNQPVNILHQEKAQKSRKRPVLSDSHKMSDSEEITPSKAKHSHIPGDKLSDLGSVTDFEGNVNSLRQQATALTKPSLADENEIHGSIVQEYNL